MSAKARVPISTVDMNLHEVGPAAARRLLHLMDGGVPVGVEYLPSQLITRESTAATSSLATSRR